MKRKLLILWSFLAGCLASASAQDNPYEIDNRCFPAFEKAETLIGKEGFEEANDALLRLAREAGDKKAETLYYVNDLKDQTARPYSEENSLQVDRAFETLKRVSRENGYTQYYYFAYQLTQNYYYNNGEKYRAMTLVQEMQQTALQEEDEFGLWTADKYLAAMYISGGDYVSAKPFILRAIKAWQETEDPTLRRQSPTRLYCDLADTYPIGSDSVHINVDKAALYSASHMDTVRIWYYQARLAALDGEDARYRELRDKFLSDSRNHQVRKYGKDIFRLMDAVLDGSIGRYKEEVVSLPSVQEIKVLANLCELRGYESLAFDIEKGIVTRMERVISSNNQSRLSELDVAMGKAVLRADLAQKETQISRISLLVFILVIVILMAILVFSLVYIRNLRRTNEKVRLADAAKTRFVQNMSHEVRTPLNAIVGFSQLLSLPDGSFPEEEKEEFAGHIVNNTKMLTMLLDDILNASAMDSGNYRITYEEGEKDFMAQAAISSSEHRLQPGVQLSYVPEEAEPFTFTTDPRRVQQILINLLTNACKHTQKGWIRLSSSLKANPGYVTYAVTDTGEGVPADQAEKIFERFTKLNEFVQGTGLGLSICRDIAGRMGAKVFLDTTYTEGGSRFVFQVPVEPPKNQ